MVEEAEASLGLRLRSGSPGPIVSAMLRRGTGLCVVVG